MRLEAAARVLKGQDDDAVVGEEADVDAEEVAEAVERALELRVGGPLRDGPDLGCNPAERQLRARSGLDWAYQEEPLVRSALRCIEGSLVRFGGGRRLWRRGSTGRDGGRGLGVPLRCEGE